MDYLCHNNVTNYFCRSLEGSNLRWQVPLDRSEGDVQFVESKEKLIRSDVSLLAFQYDIRIDCAKETPSSQSATASNLGTDALNTENWSNERLKKRKKYTPRSDHYFWQVF